MKKRDKKTENIVLISIILALAVFAFAMKEKGVLLLPVESFDGPFIIHEQYHVDYQHGVKECSVTNNNHTYCCRAANYEMYKCILNQADNCVIEDRIGECIQWSKDDQ